MMKKMTKMFILTLAMVLTMGLAVGMTSEAKGRVSKVQITSPTKKSTYTITRSDANVKKQLKVKVTVKGGASKAVTYKSSNKKVVSVSSTGMLTAKKKGTATITVTSKANKKKKDTVKITVKQAVTGVAASVKKPLASYNKVYSIIKGKTYTISAKITPSNASNKKVGYKSSKKSVASVTSAGKLKAKKTGTAKITITAKDGSKQAASFNVYVTDKIKKKAVSVSAVAGNNTLLAGETTTISTTIAPADATLKKTAYKSSNTKVATVNATTGKVTAIAPGSATITAKALDGSGKKATVKIKVAELYTSITPVKDVTADVTVTFDGDRMKAAADASKLLLAATKAGDKKSVTVNGNTGVIENKDGKEIYVGEVTLAEYIKDKTAKDDKVTVTYGANAAKAVAALELAKFTAAGEYNYTVKIDSFTFSSLVVSADGIKIKVGDKEYEAEVVQGVIYVKGDITADDLAKELAARKYAVVTTVRR